MSIKGCEKCIIKCGFENSINNLIEKKFSITNEWIVAFRSMEPKEIINFLNHWIEEVSILENKPKPDPLSKGIITNCFFKQLIEKYPGILVSSSLREKLIEKMNEKTNPFELLRKKVDNFLEQKQYDAVKDEISNLFNLYGNIIQSNEYLNEGFNKLLYNIIENYQNKEIEPNILIFIIESYLDFSKNIKGDLNLALLFIKLGSYFFEKNEIEIARKCVSKSNQIYKELGYEKDWAKTNEILNKLTRKTPKISKKKLKTGK